MDKITLPLGGFLLESKKAWQGVGQAPGMVVLCKSTERNEYITWFYNEEDKGCSSGHYHKSLRDALDDYERRTA